MKADIKRLNKQYKDNLRKLSISELEKIVYEKNFDFLLTLENFEKFYETITDIMESRDYNERLKLFNMLYISGIDASVIYREFLYKEEVLMQLKLINKKLYELEGLKSQYNMIENYKNTKDITYLDNLQLDLELSIKAKNKVLKSFNSQFEAALDILQDKKEDMEYFRSKKYMELCKKENPKLYKLLNERVYDKKVISELYSTNKELLEYNMALITDLLNNKLIEKHQGKFINPESAVYKYLAKKFEKNNN